MNNIHLMTVVTTLAFAFTTGCTQNGEDSEAIAGCQDTSSSIAADEATELGFSGADVIAGLDINYASSMIYYNAETSPLSVSFVPDEQGYRFVKSEATSSGEDDITLEMYCASRVEVDGQLSFVTEDGLFDELIDVTLVAVTAETPGLSTELDMDSLQGTYLPVRFTEDEYDTLTSRLAIDFSNGEMVGELTEHAENVDGDTASLEVREVGSFGLSEL